MASSSNSSQQETVMRKQNNGPPYKFLVPLIYAPVLPLIRIGLRKNPVVRDRLFTAVLAGAFAHGFYLVFCGCRMGFDGGCQLGTVKKWARHLSSPEKGWPE